MTIAVGQGRTASQDMVLRARASVARRMVRQGVLDGELALSLVVFPKVGYGTFGFRAYSRRGNP